MVKQNLETAVVVLEANSPENVCNPLHFYPLHFYILLILQNFFFIFLLGSFERSY